VDKRWQVDGGALDGCGLRIAVQRLAASHRRTGGELRSWGVAPLHSDGYNLCVPCDDDEAPRLGDTIPVYGYALMLFLGFYCATTWASSRLHKLGADPEIAWDVATWIFIGGIVGAPRVARSSRYVLRAFQRTHAAGLNTESPAASNASSRARNASSRSK